MTYHRSTFTALFLAMAQVACAQTPAASFGGLPTARPVPPESATTGLPVIAPVDPLSPAGGPADMATQEPRILRGNDIVIAPARPTTPLAGAPVSFNFEEAPVAEVVRTILGDVLKVDYVLHPPLAGTITLTTRAAVSPDDAVFMLESALQTNGLALSKDGRGAYHVGRPDALKGIGGVVRQAGNAPLPAGYGAIIVQLQYIGAAEMATILRPLIPTDALIRVDPLRNLLVLAGTRTQAEGWLDLVKTFDVDLLKGMSVGVFPLKNASIKEVEQALRLLGSGGSTAPGPGAATGAITANAAAGAAAATGAGSLTENPFAGALRVMPIERLNSIMVVTPRAALLDEARRWIERLDQPSDNTGEPQLYVYHVQNGSSRHLADVLNGIFGDGKQSTTSTTGNATSGVAPGLASSMGSTVVGSSGSSSLLGNTASSTGYGLRAGGLQSGIGSSGGTNRQTNATPTPSSSTLIGSVRVMADEVNNVVLVWGTRQEYAKIESTLKRLDVPPTQVLIEATIIEVTLDDTLQYGLQWFFSDKQRNGLAGTGALLNATSATAGGLTAAATNGFSYTLRSALGGDVRAVLNALASKSLLKVISSPSLMVQDNFTANIAVGSQQPINAGTTISGTSNLISNNIQYKDTGVNLSVTPSVNSGNMVSMDINQTVTDLGTLDDATKQYSFLQRQITSKVAVRSGESLVLGGLIRDNTTKGRSGIPLLQDIPVVGTLFGSTTVSTARTELLVIITPRVVRSDQELRDVSGELRDRMRGLAPIEAQESRNRPLGTEAPVGPTVGPIR